MEALAETQVKVKQIARRLINKGKTDLSKPLKKLFLEMSFGILLTGSCTLNEVTLVALKNKNSQEPIIFLPNGWIKGSKELKRRIRGYFYRWGVEESYRFEKQRFGIEKSTVRNYDRIKSLIGLSLFAWLLLVKAKQD